MLFQLFYPLRGRVWINPLKGVITPVLCNTPSIYMARGIIRGGGVNQGCTVKPIARGRSESIYRYQIAQCSNPTAFESNPIQISIESNRDLIRFSRTCATPRFLFIPSDMKSWIKPCSTISMANTSRYTACLSPMKPVTTIESHALGMPIGPLGLFV